MRTEAVTSREMIYKAIRDHALWRNRLETAVKTKSVSLTIEDVASDVQCAFGRWLYSSDIPAKLRASPFFKDACDLHFVFHTRAASILTAIVANGAADQHIVSQLMEEYMSASAELITVMENWEDDIVRNCG